MKRFLVLQNIVLQSDKGAQRMEEPVMDFDSFEEASDWIAVQPDPTILFVEDQFPEDDIEIEPFGSHDFDYYEMREPEIFEEEDDFVYDDERPFDGDGDAD